jgi:cytosine/adenosine deaminase-related metal-dependent hydrolase
MARAFLSHVSRDALAALDGVPEPEIEAILEDLRELPVVHPSMRVEFPAALSPALERLTDAYATGDPNRAWAPLDAILEEIDTPLERARLIRVVLALHDDGRLDEHSAAAAAFELSCGSRDLLRECLTEAVAAWVSDAYVRRGLPAALSASAGEGDAPAG